MRAPYDAARALYPLLPQWYELIEDGVTPEFRGLNAGGLPVFGVPLHYTLMADEGAHEAGHAYQKLLEHADSTYDYLTAYWLFRGFAGTWQDALAGSRAIANRPATTQDEQRANANESWLYDPRESWAEAFARSCVPTHNEKTMNFGKDMNPLLLRAFFTSLHNHSAIGTVVQPPVVVPTPIVVGSISPTIEWFGPIPGSNFMQGRDGNPITLIVDHWMAGTLASADSRFKNQTQRVSAHYGVTRDGRIVQWVADADTAYHAGDWTKNTLSIGIEHEASPTMPPTDALYAASAWLHAQLAAKHNIPLTVGVTVLPHRAIVATACPGTLDLDRIVAEAGLEEDMDRPTFDKWFAENYTAYGVAALFDKMKAVDAALLTANTADDTRDAAQQAALNGKADKGHGHTATTTVS